MARMWTCQSCDTKVEAKKEFCPSCGFHRGGFHGTIVSDDNTIDDSSTEKDSAENKVDHYNTPKEQPIDKVIRKMGNDINTIKNILIFFTIVWIVSMIIYIANAS